VIAQGNSRQPHVAPRSGVNDDERTDATLLAATARGDDAAFGVLVRRYIRLATFLAAQFLGNRRDAEDIVQDAFVVVWRTARRFDVDRPFAPWFFAIVRRLAANRRSRDLRRIRLLHLWQWVSGREPASAPAEPLLIARLDAATAKRAMKTLSPMQRACFELVAVRGLSPREVAMMHGISESTVRQHVFRARAALRSVLTDSERGLDEP
jgi:RNA polymerase sigma-70 factor, ECF subfamily